MCISYWSAVSFTLFLCNSLNLGHNIPRVRACSCDKRSLIGICRCNGEVADPGKTKVILPAGVCVSGGESALVTTSQAITLHDASLGGLGRD